MEDEEAEENRSTYAGREDFGRNEEICAIA
jgi:hypothetical protein